MKASELIHILQKEPEARVLVRIGNGLFCPIEQVSKLDDNIVIVGKDIRIIANTLQAAEFKKDEEV